jgi:hypothetical protein
MAAFLDLQILPLELLACNHCRMHLRVILLSDIVSGDGLSLLNNKWQGIPFISEQKHRSWPKYGKPSSTAWNIWRKWAKATFLSRGRKLRTPLGRWLRMDESWPWYISKEGTLLQFKQGKWFSHVSVIRCNRLPTFKTNIMKANHQNPFSGPRSTLKEIELSAQAQLLSSLKKSQSRTLFRPFWNKIRT